MTEQLRCVAVRVAVDQSTVDVVVVPVAQCDLGHRPTYGGLIAATGLRLAWYERHPVRRADSQIGHGVVRVHDNHVWCDHTFYKGSKKATMR